MSLDAGTKLGHYEIRSQLGTGGMGEVYLAQDSRLDRKVALKILPAEVAANQDRMRRFGLEAKAAATLNHPNIAHIYEIGEADGVNFIAMEFVDGETLSKLIHSGQIEFTKLLRYLQHAAEALAKAHGAGIVHRDLKPDNIMVTREGHAKILDFGLAKLVEPQKSSGSDSSNVATAILQQQSKAGLIVGTVGYMSPEQAQGKTKEIDHRSDIFSFGCILFEAVTRHKAFAGTDVVDSLNKIIREPAPPLSEFNPAATPDLQRIVRRCLAKDPDERYQSIKEVSIELKEVRRDLAGSVGLDTTVPPPSRNESTSSVAAGSGVTGAASTSLSSRASSAEYLFSGIKQHKVAVAIIAALVLLAVVAGTIGISTYLHARDSEAAIESIAVLPFENQNQNPDAEYLADGVTESIINNLSQLPNLRVSPRSTVFHYKGKGTDPVVIGKELGVRAVLTGRVVQRGDNLTISVELVDVRDNKQLWGEQYNRKVVDALALQQDISREISERLRLKLPGTGQQQLARRNPRNAEAYQLYLKGRYYLFKGSQDGMLKAIENFNQALEMDPNYALAYAGLADAYYGQADVKYSPRDSMPRMKAAAEKALQLDETLAEAHNSLAIVSYVYDWDWPTAEREFKRAIELDPNYVFAHHQYGWLLALSGRQTEAAAELAQASRLDPLSPLVTVDNNISYVLSKQYDRALEFAQKGEEMDPNFFLAHFVQGWIYDKKGDYERSIAKLQRARQLEDQPWILCWLGHAYAASGDRQNAQKIISELSDLSKRRYVSPYFTATVHAGLKDKEKTLEYLEKAYQDKSVWLGWLRTEDIFDFLRPDPRFQDLLRRVGLPE
ncbi:MAG: protein kinase [Acidobacteriota bacterium]